MKASLLIGIVAALLAALAWSLNFIVPYVICDYSIFDIALVRFLISGLLASSYLIFKWEKVRRLRAQDWLTSFALGVIGYLVYFQALAAPAVYAGPVIAPASLAHAHGACRNGRPPRRRYNRDPDFPQPSGHRAIISIS